MHKNILRLMSWVLINAFIMISFAGCGSTPPPQQTIEDNDSSNEHDESNDDSTGDTDSADVPDTIFEDESDDNSSEDVDNIIVPEDTEEEQLIDGMTLKQWNSIRMLNYLTVISQEVRASKNSRLFLENVYNSLLNNTYPNAVDLRTEAHLEDLLDTLENYRMLGVKRERLQYIYEQNRAKAMRAAIPNPVGLLSAVQSGDPLKAALSVIYMAVDSYSSYTAYTEETDLQYLQDGWALDDEESAEVHNSRLMAFSYMLGMVRENELDGESALNENAVDQFVEWKNNTNVTRRIQFLESNEKTYKALGEYWIVLAHSYFENENYQKCLDAISHYESAGAKIFRKDYDYGKVLPRAILSARNILEEADYIKAADKYLPLIIENSDISDWAINYFVASTYADLYARTNNVTYIEAAYKLEKDVVNELIDEQQKLNEKYLADIQEVEADKNADKKEKKEVASYNKMIKEQRKIELPPISDALYINCEMLLALANELNLSSSQKNELDKMLHDNGEALFLNQFAEAKTHFTNSTITALSSPIISYSGDELHIPAVLLSNDSVIKTVIKSADGTITIDDWKLEEVDRKKKTLSEFDAKYMSSAAKKVKYTDGTIVQVYIYKDREALEPEAIIRFKATEYTKFGVFHPLSFLRIDE